MPPTLMPSRPVTKVSGKKYRTTWSLHCRCNQRKPVHQEFRTFAERSTELTPRSQSSRACPTFQENDFLRKTSPNPRCKAQVTVVRAMAVTTCSSHADRMGVEQSGRGTDIPPPNLTLEAAVCALQHSATLLPCPHFILPNASLFPIIHWPAVSPFHPFTLSPSPAYRK
jgi:hypothetical protein